jgi:hypothetical protein
MNPAGSSLTSRRDFLSTTTKLAAASAFAGMTVPLAHAAGSDLIQLALIGCGGRGTAAVGHESKLRTIAVDRSRGTGFLYTHGLSAAGGIRLRQEFCRLSY